MQYSGYKFFIQYVIYAYFFQVCGLSFHNISCPTKALRFDRPVSHCFLFYGHALGLAQGIEKPISLSLQPTHWHPALKHLFREAEEIACRKMASSRGRHGHLFLAVGRFYKSLFTGRRGNCFSSFFPPDLFSLIYPCSRFLQVWDTERTKVDPDPRVVGSWTKRARGAG